LTLPVSLTGKYQLVLLASEGDTDFAGYVSRLRNALAICFGQLGVNIGKFLLCLTSGAVGPPLDRTLPTVGVFFGSTSPARLSVDDAARLDQLLGDGVLVVPVVTDMMKFSDLVPASIRAFNGTSVAECGVEFERLGARVLEGFGLLREKRRLFISYRRIETSGIAAQLYEALDAAGFDVFLDTHGVLRPGEPFQDILWHRLADTDVGLLLDSPGFLASRWTEEELARANTSNIQLLQLLWPGRTEGATAAFSTFYPLTVDEFADGTMTVGPSARLSDNVVGRIVDAAEALRARAIGARLAFMVREFVIESRRAGLTVQTTLERALVLSGPHGRRVFVLPAIGVPDAERYEHLVQLQERETKKGHSYLNPPILLYDQTGIRTRWLQHLRWLNNNLECARSLSLVDARDWLGDLATKGAL
jgi:hypothetical protein